MFTIYEQIEEAPERVKEVVRDMVTALRAIAAPDPRTIADLEAYQTFLRVTAARVDRATASFLVKPRIASMLKAWNAGGHALPLDDPIELGRECREGELPQ
jgi:hypothetical protein